jgi:hypothetical protein
MGVRNRVGIELSYRPARLQRPAEFTPWNRFLDSIKLKNTGSGKRLAPGNQPQEHGPLDGGDGG